MGTALVHGAARARLWRQRGTVAVYHGEAVPVETRVESAWLQRLKLKYNKLLSGFAFKFNLRSYTTVPANSTLTYQVRTRTFQSFPFQLNLSILERFQVKHQGQTGPN